MKHLRMYISPAEIDKVAEAIAEEIGQQEVAISGEKVKLKELY